MFNSLTLISRLEKPVLTPRCKRWDAFDVHSNHVVYDPYRMYYRIYYNNTTKVPRYYQGAIGMAFSEDGLPRFVRSHIPLLRGGGRHAWDRWLWKVRVMCLGKGDWRMWYGGVATKGFFLKKRIVGVGLATSEDAWRWIKHEKNPIVTCDNQQIYDFTPIYDEYASQHKFRALYYMGENGCVGLMKSKDGVEWDEDFSSPVLTPLSDSWEAETISPKCLLKVDGVFVLAYEAGMTGEYRIGLAYSKDLIHWWRDQRNPILEPRPDCFDSKYVADPSLILNGDELRVYYGAKNQKGEGTVGLAVFKT